ncbi:MAG: alpha-D-ribose 1-methylphosphonate 5-triphosphate diphosphatase [Alphaproteobacteria bacterium]|nr:alpha-D-ribose 1-methylphosphonate 5-triphosphate diphosphatase [Alphaproteobacteria bacterium]
MPDSVSAAEVTVINNTRALLPEGLQEGVSIVFQGGKIAEITDHTMVADHVIDGSSMTLLPGIVDLHGDAFEREIAPRPGVAFPLDLAIEANDTTLISNGVTTFFYSITDGFEPGVRSRETVQGLINIIEAKRPTLRSDSRLHIRHETAATDGHDELLDWIKSRRIDLLSLNDHLPPVGNEAKINRYVDGALRRVKMPADEMLALIHARQDQRGLGEAQVLDLAAAAHEVGLTLASHDERTDEDAAQAARLKVGICEFPLTERCAELAVGRGAAVVMGAPNLVRGGSHIGGTSVRDEVAAGRVTVLVSDYYYPALLRAPFMLAELDICSLADAWQLVSGNPARAAGLAGVKGEIAVGADADLLGLKSQTGGMLNGYSGELALVTSRGKTVLTY